MSEGMSILEQNILRFETVLAELRDSVRESHIILKDLKAERKEIEKLLTTDVKKMLEDQVDKVVKELDQIGPEVSKQCHLIYDKVGDQIDKLISLTLGKEFATKKGHEDLRPLLAIKLREWIQEVINEERSSEIPKLCDKKLHFNGEECSTKNCSWNYHWTKDGKAFAKPDLCDNRHFIGVECLTKNCSWNH